MGLRSCPIGRLVLEDVRVGGDAVLGGEGVGATVFSQSMDWERACLGATTWGRAASPRRFGRPRPRAQVERSANREAPGGEPQDRGHEGPSRSFRLLVYQAAWRLERTRAAAIDASIAKIHVSDSLVATAHDAVQIMGGYGFLCEQG